MAAGDFIRVGILGASGYTGAELIRLLHGHPQTKIAFLTANSHAGQPMAALYPHLSALDLPVLRETAETDPRDADVIFCALPHGATQEIVTRLLEQAPQTRIVDLSADFRLHDPKAYEYWYGAPHRALAAQRQAVYGLTEIHRAAVAQTRLVANPGCYSTATLLALIPPVESGILRLEDLIVDAKSGISGAGRVERRQYLYGETAESLSAYGVGGHRHVAELEQELPRAAGKAPDNAVRIGFTPHLVPMMRGILATCHARLADGASAADVHACLRARYHGEPFIHVLAAGEAPATRDVRGGNHCRIAVFPDRLPGRVILVSVIDNLVKGASGQAIQNMNILFGLPETTGLQGLALFP